MTSEFFAQEARAAGDLWDVCWPLEEISSVLMSRGMMFERSSNSKIFFTTMYLWRQIVCFELFDYSLNFRDKEWSGVPNTNPTDVLEFQSHTKRKQLLCFYQVLICFNAFNFILSGLRRSWILLGHELALQLWRFVELQGLGEGSSHVTSRADGCSTADEALPGPFGQAFIFGLRLKAGHRNLQKLLF